MTKTLTELFVVFALALSACSSSGDILRLKYPYSRLTNDYGILTDQDFKVSERNAQPVPFSDDSLAYPYWKCFPTSVIKFSCLDLDTDDHGAQMSIILIQAENDDYGGRHGIPLETCEKEYLSKWRSLVKSEAFVCLAGFYSNSSHEKHHWTYDRLKTKKGCVSYFPGDC